MTKASLGDLELEVLRFIVANGPLSVGEVTERFGASKGLSRSAINTTIERLFKKKFLTRQHEGSSYRYAPAAPAEEILGNVVERFVERTLGGSLSPFMAYFSKKSGLTKEEMTELERLIEKLEDSPQEEGR